jgi:hypothetical protein
MTASNIWQDIVAAGGSYKDKAMNFTFEVNLVDKNTNSLKQLNQYINNLYKINSERKNRNRDTAEEHEKDIRTFPGIVIRISKTKPGGCLKAILIVNVSLRLSKDRRTQ